MTYLINENAPTRCCNTGEGNDKNPMSPKESAMTSLATDRKSLYHPHWCDPDQCFLDDSGGIPRDIFHHSPDAKVQYGSAGETLNVGTTLVVNFDGDLNPGEEPIEGRVGAFGYSLTVREAEELALALLRAARAADRSVLALTNWPATLDFVEEALEDYDGHVDHPAVARDLIDRWGTFADVDDLLGKVPPQEWWAIVRKHTQAEDTDA